MSVNPQLVNTINNTEKNTFNITPTLSQLGQTIGENIAPTFTQASGGPYVGALNTSAFNLSGTTNTTIPYAAGTYTLPTFSPSSSSGTLTITAVYGTHTSANVFPGSGGAVDRAYGLFAETPLGATNNYTAAFIGFVGGTRVGIGTQTPNQTLSVVGGTSYAVTQVTTPTYSVLNTDNTLEVNVAGPVTITLPAASPANSGQVFTIKDASGQAQTNLITVNTAGGLIDGAPSEVIGSNYGFLGLFSDGTNYYLDTAKTGSTNLSVKSVITSSYSVLNTDNIIEVNTSSTPVAITLPAASAANKGQLYLIKDVSGQGQTNNITVGTAGGNIDGAPSQVLGTNYGFLEVFSDGTNYYIADTTPPAPGPAWVNVTGTSQALSVNTGYFTTNAAATTLTLPTTAAVGSIIQVTGAGTGLFTIAQNPLQQIRLGGFTTTTGPLGSLASTSPGDTVELLCTVANTNFQVLDAVGNLVVS